MIAIAMGDPIGTGPKILLKTWSEGEISSVIVILGLPFMRTTGDYDIGRRQIGGLTTKFILETDL